MIKDASDRAPAQVTPANIHIGIDTSDLRKLCAILEKEGATFVRLFKQRSDGLGFSGWVRDPDGHELELAETTFAPVINFLVVVVIVSCQDRARLILSIESCYEP